MDASVSRTSRGRFLCLCHQFSYHDILSLDSPAQERRPNPGSRHINGAFILETANEQSKRKQSKTNSPRQTSLCSSAIVPSAAPNLPILNHPFQEVGWSSFWTRESIISSQYLSQQSKNYLPSLFGTNSRPVLAPFLHFADCLRGLALLEKPRLDLSLEYRAIPGFSGPKKWLVPIGHSSLSLRKQPAYIPV